jgi:glutaconate CoA-transferase subunit A
MTGHDATRARVDVDLSEAFGTIADGSVIGLGGTLTAGRPMALLRQLLRQRPKDLTLVSPVASIDIDLAVATGCVRRVITSYVGAEAVAGTGPIFRAAVERGDVEVVDRDEAHCILGLRAAGQGLPFLPWLGGVGTDLPKTQPEMVEFADPITGRTLLAIPAINLDVALIHAEVADAYGNVQFAGTGHTDMQLASAAKKVIVECDRLVSNEEIRRNPTATYFWRDTTVVRAPFGTHPFASAAINVDEVALKDFVARARKAIKGNPSELEAFINQSVFESASHEAYLEGVGIRKIVRLLT